MFLGTLILYRPLGFAVGMLLDRRDTLVYNELEYLWEEICGEIKVFY